MYTLKSTARRGTMLGAAFALVAVTAFPAAVAFADALNPLTERSLLLSSSAPGFTDTDGAGNSEDSPNSIGEFYAPAGSGPNGKKTGETFTFRVSSDSTSRAIKGFSLQYCTSAAGFCQSPGDNLGDERDSDRETNVVAHPNERSDLDVVYDTPVLGTDFDIYVDENDDGDFADANETNFAGWAMDAFNEEDDAHSGALTGKNNFITLVNTTGAVPVNGAQIKIVFNADTDDYITNPGSGSFFVKINTYDTADPELFVNEVAPDVNPNLIDGGVTVANVMTDSIHITTKVLETMAFSVGVHNRDTEDLDGPAGPVRNGTCDAIEVVDSNRLNLGNPNAEFSLETGRAWDVYSYWRLSSNSSGGATVYYSGDTLRNTVGDFILPMDPQATLSNPGTEQFGLAFVDDTEMQDEVSQSFLDEVANDPDNYKLPEIDPLVKETPYVGGSGNIGEGVDGETIDAEFAFDVDSSETPAVIAQNNDAVLSCATAKMRYVGNIAADTPAGVYTTKINYLAAPQY